MTVAHHLLVDAYGCAGPLDDPDALLAAMRRGADAGRCEIRGEGLVRFVPHGVTATIVLAESHIVVSTWPEHGTALVDVLLCTAGADPEAVWGPIAAALAPERVEKRLLLRVVGP